jgi:hypothetical protein
MLLVPPPTFLRNPICILRAAMGFMGLPGGYSDREIDYLKETEAFEAHETGYQRIQSTKPQVRQARASLL